MLSVVGTVLNLLPGDTDYTEAGDYYSNKLGNWVKENWVTDKEAYYDGRGYGSALCAVEGIVAILAGGAAIIGGGIVGFGGGLLSLSGFGSVAGAPALALSGELIAAGGLAIEGGIGMVGSSYDKIEVYKSEATNSSEAKVKEKADKLNEAKVGSVTDGVNNPNLQEILDGLKSAKVREKLNPKTGKMEPYMKQYKINDDYKVLLRKDIGGFNDHDLMGDHWNFEVQTSGGRTIYDLHVYIDESGNLKPFTDDDIYIPKKSPFR